MPVNGFTTRHVGAGGDVGGGLVVGGDVDGGDEGGGLVGDGLAGGGLEGAGRWVVGGDTAGGEVVREVPAWRGVAAGSAVVGAIPRARSWAMSDWIASD